MDDIDPRYNTYKTDHYDPHQAVLTQFRLQMVDKVAVA